MIAEPGLTTAAEPDGAPRLLVLDVLRGVAILAILFMNINEMGGSLYASSMGEPRHLGWSRADQLAWWVREVLANGTARCLLEMLFGAGMVILTDRAASRMDGWRLLRGYARRNLVLFLFGLVHVFVLLWPGDILHTYGLAALVAVLFRGLKPRLLLTLGLAFAVVQLGDGIFATAQSNGLRAAAEAAQVRAARGLPLTLADRDAVTDLATREATRAEERAAVAAQVAAEDRARTGDARSWAAAAWRAFLSIEQQLLEPLFVWEAASTMLIGAALFRWGVIQGERTRAFYLALTIGGYAMGLSLRAWEAYALTRFDWRPSYAYAPGELARLATTLGHLGLVDLLLASAAGRRLLRPFAAAGRTALTLDILQTVICLWVLYPPWGFGLYGRQGWAALMATAVAIDLALLALAIWWTRRFAIAPVEWVWRSIVAGRALLFRRARAGIPQA